MIQRVTECYADKSMHAASGSLRLFVFFLSFKNETPLKFLEPPMYLVGN